jgi:hypothetical protein
MAVSELAPACVRLGEMEHHHPLLAQLPCHLLLQACRYQDHRSEQMHILV